MKFLPVDDFVGFKIRVCEVLVGYHQEFSVTQSENEIMPFHSRKMPYIQNDFVG